MRWAIHKVKWSMVSTAFFSVMTLLAVAPYDLGSVALAFPPWAKPWIFGFGLPLTALSRLFAAKKKPEEQKAAPPPSAPAVQNTYNLYFYQK